MSKDKSKYYNENTDKKVKNSKTKIQLVVINKKQ